jgi:GT2 family glycosyltransferase
MTPDVQIVLMVYKSRRVLPQFLETVGTTLPIILVDNSYAEDDLSDILAGYPNVTRLDAGGNIGYSAAANLGARAATSEIIILMNPDTRPSAESLLELARYLDTHPDTGACGAAGVGTAGGGAQPTALRILAHTLGWHRRSALSGVFFQDLGGCHIEVEWVAGSCLAIRRDLYAAIGGFDPSYYIYMSDFDLGRRLQEAGYRQMVLGDVVVPHDDGGSSDLPAIWTWERRGRAWTRYLRATRSLPAGLGLTVLLVAGYAIRAFAYTVARNHNKSLELRTYLGSVLREWASATSSQPQL